jgi:hypothetical protein
MNNHLVEAQVKGDIRVMEKVIREVFLDDVAFVATADNKVVNAVRRIHFEDVPQNRATSNLNHRLWLYTGFFT